MAARESSRREDTGGAPWSSGKRAVPARPQNPNETTLRDAGRKSGIVDNDTHLLLIEANPPILLAAHAYRNTIVRWHGAHAFRAIRASSHPWERGGDMGQARPCARAAIWLPRIGTCRHTRVVNSSLF